MRCSKQFLYWIPNLSPALLVGAIYFFLVSPAWPAATPLDRAASVAFPLYVDTGNGTKRACTGFYVRPLAVNGATGEPVAGWVLTAGHCVVHGIVTRAEAVASYEEGHPAVGKAVRGGMSGSPVVTWDGRVAGILVATRCKGPKVPELGCDDDAYDATATPIAQVLVALRIVEPRFFEPPLVVWPKGF